MRIGEGFDRACQTAVAHLETIADAVEFSKDNTEVSGRKITRGNPLYPVGNAWRSFLDEMPFLFLALAFVFQCDCFDCIFLGEFFVLYLCFTSSLPPHIPSRAHPQVAL